jgi:hypothetical protein
VPEESAEGRAAHDAAADRCAALGVVGAVLDVVHQGAAGDAADGAADDGSGDGTAAPLAVADAAAADGRHDQYGPHETLQVTHAPPPGLLRQAGWG